MQLSSLERLLFQKVSKVAFYLAARRPNTPIEERMQMEATAIQSSATNEQLEAIRRAGEASLRNQYREQNQSTLYPDPNTSISTSSSARSTPTLSFMGAGGS